MSVVECEVPAVSAIGRDVVEAAYFRDAYRSDLKRGELDMTELFFAMFGHAPLYVKVLLTVRNSLAKLAGLESPTMDEIWKTSNKGSYRIGEKIGPWPIFALNERELVAGRNNKHLDFRLSVMKAAGTGGQGVVVSTVCSVHNVWGKIYLFFIVPFHRFGVKSLMVRAAAAGRI